MASNAVLGRDEPLPPLCVDADGALIRTSVLVEECLRLLRQNVLHSFSIAAWALRGRRVLEAEVAQRVSLDPASVPINREVLELLEAAHQSGRYLVLCTRTDRAFAERLAQHFGIFDEVIADGRDRDATLPARTELLVGRFGEHGFDYVCDARACGSVARHARETVLVPHVRGEPESARASRLARAAGRLRPWLRALRLHQWSKNLLLFVPAAMAHRIAEPATAVTLLAAFVAFGLCASATYLMNDLLDLDADRAHPRKRHRPFASGELPVLHGLLVAAGALLLGLLIAVRIGVLFTAILGCYVLITLWYSLRLKRMAMVDVLCLAGLYSIRVVAGGAAVAIMPSFWLLAFSMFLFLSLAIAKRYVELCGLQERGELAAAGRGYSVADLPLLLASGTNAGLLAVRVLALYIHEASQVHYSRPQVLWFVCPPLLYWISRVWLKTHRGQLHDDPVVFALRDRPSVLTGIGICALVWAAV